jgi:hypothetical protein
LPSAASLSKLTGLAAALMLSLGGTQAHAQAFGSVHCKAAIRFVGVDLQATERKLSSVENGTVDEKCSAMRVRVLTLEHASEVYGRCMEGNERADNVGQAEASAAGLRDQIAKTCGG